jgi:lysophospholipase L1-like esterase
MRKYIRKIAAIYNDTVIDVHPYVGSKDNVHLTQHGYQAVARKFKAYAK